MDTKAEGKRVMVKLLRARAMGVAHKGRGRWKVEGAKHVGRFSASFIVHVENMHPRVTT